MQISIVKLTAVNPNETGFTIDFEGSYLEGTMSGIAESATEDKLYMYLNAFSESEGKFKVKRFKIVDGRLVGKRKKTPQVDVIREEDNDYQPWAADDGIVGILSEISGIGFAPLPVDGEGDLTLAYRERARNEDLRLYSNKRSTEIDTFKTAVEETYAKLDWANEVDSKILEHTDSITSILEAVGANTAGIKALEDRATALETSLSETSEALTGLTTRVETLETHDTDHEERITALETDMVDVKGKAQKITDLEAQVAKNKTDIENNKFASDTIHEALSEELNSVKSKVSANEANIRILQTQESGLNDNFVEMKNTFDTTMESLNGFQESIDGINSKNTQISERLDTVNTDITALKAKDEAHDSAIEALQNKDIEVQTKLDALETKDTELTGFVDSLTTKVDTLETKHDSDVETLTTLISDTKTEIEKDIEDELLVVQGNLDALSEKDAQQDTLISQAILKNNTQENQIKELQSLSSGLNTNVKAIEGSIESLQNDVEVLQTDVGGLQTRVGTLETDLDEHKTEFNTHKEYVIKELSNLSTKVDSNTARIAELDRSITSMQETVEGELNSYKETANFEIQSLKDLTSRHTTEIDQIKNDLSQVQINISDLEGSTKAVILESEDGIEELDENTFGLLCLGDIELSDVDYSNILVDITTLKAQNQQLLNRVQTLETENQNLKTKINV